MRSHPISIRLEADLAAEIDRVAVKEGRTRADMARRLLREGLATHHAETVASMVQDTRQPRRRRTA